MIDFVQQGEFFPSAEAVADRAGVGLRSVFRHFKDMEGLYREIGEASIRLTAPHLAKPFTKTQWRDQLDEFIERKAAFFEDVMMYYIAGNLHRYDSAYARMIQESTVTTERKSLRRILPEEVRKDRDLFEALDLLLSFDSWIRLRKSQNLTVRRSIDVLKKSLATLLPRKATRSRPASKSASAATKKS